VIQDFGPHDQKLSLHECGLVSPAVSLDITRETGAITRIATGHIYEKNRMYVSVDQDVKGGISSDMLKVLPDETDSFVRKKIVDFPLARVVLFKVKDEFMTYVYEKKRGKWYRTGKKRRRTSNETVNEFFLIMNNLMIDTFIFDEEFGITTKEYIFYDRERTLLSHLVIGESQDDYVKIMFKDKRGIFRVERKIIEALPF